MEMQPEQTLMDLRKRVVDGDEVTPEEYKQIVDNLRSDRMSAKPKARTSKKVENEKRALELFSPDLQDLIK